MNTDIFFHCVCLCFFLIRSDKSEKPILLPKSIFGSIHQCQKCGREHAENSMICSLCQENELIGREIEINQNFLDQQVRS